MPADTSEFVRKRIHSLTGIIPIGAFVLIHFYNMSFSLGGAEAFNRHLDELRQRPYQPILELVFIFIPILYHGLYGLWMSFGASIGAVKYRYLNNWRYILQRLSGIGVLLFVGAHVYKTKIEPWQYGFKLDFEHMHEGLSDPLTLTVYLLGVLGASFHLGNGLWTFGITWGIWKGPKAQKCLTVVSIAIFVVVLLYGLNAIFGFLGLGIGGSNFTAGAQSRTEQALAAHAIAST